MKTKSDWRLEHFVLEDKKLPGSHIAEHLPEAIKECINDLKIEESNISCITIANASNNVKAVEQVLEWPYLPCFAHTLNFAVKVALPYQGCKKLFQNGQTL